MMILLTALGLIPFALGSFMNWFMMTRPDDLPPFTLFAVITLLIWTAIAFIANSRVKCTKKVVIFLNLVGLIDLALLGIQELLLGAYWNNLAGPLTQFYYLPLINLGFRLTNWSHTVFSAYCAAFVLMVAASILGCALRKKK
ncbi:MAG: hypothetical protein J6B95_00975 [Oscillospiraceae bacterium]|nr:hypothetical protein [Oscillospiraceae bacterium]